MSRNTLKKSLPRPWSICLAGMVSAVLLVSSAVAVDFHPQIKEKLIEQGRWERIKQVIISARQAGMDAARTATTLAAGTRGTGFASRIPCILVEFTDNLWASGTANTSAEYFDSLLFSEGVHPTGSMRDFYLENSYGVHDVEGEVVGPILMPREYSYYVGSEMGISTNEPNSRTLAYDAFQLADHLLDYSEYDANGDDVVDGVMIVFAGPGAEESIDTALIQSHRWELPIDKWETYDGVIVKDYTIQPEEHGTGFGGGSNSVGVFCHEWGHIFDLPDLYDLDGSSWGIGKWSLMGSGNYLNNSNTPAHFDPWCKKRLGWVNIDTVEVNRVDQAISAFATTPTVFLLWTPGMLSSEYFLVCSRQQTGFDSHLPGSGLLILHIDDQQNDNRDEYIPGQGNPIFHYKVAVEQADGKYQLESSASGNQGDAGDLYTDESAEFDDLTDPGSRSYFYTIPTQVAVWNISPPGPVMTANLDVTFSRPLLQLQSYSFVDTLENNDGIPDPGETVDLLLTTINRWKSTTDINISVSCSSPAVVFSDNTSYIPSLGSGQIYMNHGDPVRFTVTAGAQPTIADFFVSYECEDGAFTFAETLHVDLGPKQVLLVDGDADYNERSYHYYYYVTALEALRVPYEVYDKNTQGSPTGAELMDYPVVWWYTGDVRDSLIIHDDVVAMQTYLDAGGRLFLTGQNVAEELSQTADSLFLPDYLGARYDGSLLGMPFLSGVDSDPIGDGITLVIGGSGGAANQHNPDSLRPVPGAWSSFHYSKKYPPEGEGGVGGVAYEHGGFKTVFWGFGFEAVTPDAVPGLGVSREQALSRVLYWLAGLVTGILEEKDDVEEELTASTLPSRYTLFQNYPNPFNGRTVIEFSVAPGRSNDIKIDIINILGQRVATVFEGWVEPGVHQVEWDGRSGSGYEVASGVYFYRIVADDGFMQSRRMVYLK